MALPAGAAGQLRNALRLSGALAPSESFLLACCGRARRVLVWGCQLSVIPLERVGARGQASRYSVGSRAGVEARGRGLHSSFINRCDGSKSTDWTLNHRK